MKFFSYPLTSSNLHEFTRPGSTLLGHVVEATLNDDPVTLAGNGFIAVLDLLNIRDHGHVSAFPPAVQKLSSLPWHLFDGLADHARHHHRGMNRDVDSWVAFDDHSGGFAKHRRRDLFTANGAADLFGYFAIGEARVPVPPQVLNLVRKLPRARFWVPRTSIYEPQKFLPVKFNGGLALIGALPEKTAARLPELGTVCAARGHDPMAN